MFSDKMKKTIKEEIIVQAGHTKYKSKNLEIFDFIDNDSLEEYQRKISQSIYYCRC